MARLSYWYKRADHNVKWGCPLLPNYYYCTLGVSARDKTLAAFSGQGKDDSEIASARLAGEPRLVCYHYGCSDGLALSALAPPSSSPPTLSWSTWCRAAMKLVESSREEGEEAADIGTV